MKRSRNTAEDAQTLASDRRVASDKFRIGQTTCDLRSGFVRRGNQEEKLEPRLIAVLSVLVQHAPEPVTRDMFLELVWDGEGSDEALTQAISRLRRIFSDEYAIKTHPRIGYSLPSLEVASNETSSWLKPGPVTQKSDQLHMVRIAFFAGLACSLVLIGVLIGHFWPMASKEQEFIPLEPEVEFLPKQ